jgi:hypothetical protein
MAARMLRSIRKGPGSKYILQRHIPTDPLLPTRLYFPQFHHHPVAYPDVKSINTPLIRPKPSCSKHLWECPHKHTQRYALLNPGIPQFSQVDNQD